jgi:SWI/SNF-related matrix-associated actin-dependent regulator of chromatin subfamily A-like protein 1
MYKIYFNENNTRIILEGTFNGCSSIIGAKKIRKGYSYPIDPIVIYGLKKYENDFDLDFRFDVLEFYSEYLTKIKKIEELKSQKSNIVTLNKVIDYNLKDYQKMAIEFFIKSKKCILGDDMGLGKTLSAIGAIQYLLASKVLIVCPSYVKYNWAVELQKWLHEYPSIIIEGTKDRRKKLIESSKTYSRCITIVNYEMLQGKEVIKPFGRIRKKVIEFKYEELLCSYDIVIFDECHKLKNRKSQAVEGAKKLIAPYKFFMTGTPINKNIGEVWQILNLIDQDRFKSYWNFVNYYCNVIRNDFGGYEIGGLLRPQEYKMLLNEFMLRRIKEDVIELPKKVVNEIHVQLFNTHKKRYKNLFKYVDGYGNIIESDVELFIRLQQCVMSPKTVGYNEKSTVFETILDLTEDIKEKSENKRLIIAFDSMLSAKIFHEELKELNFNKGNFLLITGEVQPKKRHELLSVFEKISDMVLITTIKALSEGVNIDYCDNMVLTDISYSNAVNEQFYNRIHRMTSINIKNYYHLIVDDTCQYFKYYKLKSETLSNYKILGDNERNIEIQISKEFFQNKKYNLKIKGVN